MNATEVYQLFISGVISGSAYALLAVGFGLILQVTGRFHLAFSVSYALAGYIASEVTISLGAPWVVGLLAAAAVAALFGILVEHFIYAPLTPRAGEFTLLAVFAAALGLTTAGTGLMNLIWIGEASNQISGFSISAISLGEARITNLDLWNVVVCWVLILAVWAIVARTTLGRMIRAVRSNPVMSLAVGISPRLVYLTVFGIGSALGGVGAVFTGTKGAVTADMGAASILYALTIVFLAGDRASPIKIGLVGLGIGLVENEATLWVSPSWSPVIVFGILLVYALIKPYRVRPAFRRRPQVNPATTA